MILFNLAVPTALANDLKSGGRKLSAPELARLGSMLTHIENPHPRFWGSEQIISQHRLWNSPQAAEYAGTWLDGFAPGCVDVGRVLIIGEADEDSPIALDYSTDEPRVIYLGYVELHSVWIEIASGYQQLLEALKGGATLP